MMKPASRDIFTEPTDVDPDTLSNLGPLRRLGGRWRARQGRTAEEGTGPDGDE